MAAGTSGMPNDRYCLRMSGLKRLGESEPSRATIRRLKGSISTLPITMPSRMPYEPSRGTATR
ncbi:MAG TPA: hypothetical protein DCP20_03135 [Coriobacteriia bacterium]|nr:hypothetical protein [Coriobacteriia bacterium]